MRALARVPCLGEAFITGAGTYVVTEVQWQPDGTPKVIARQQ